MEKTIKTKYLRTSVKKLRILTEALKGQNAMTMLEQLNVQPQKSMSLVRSALKSGIYLFAEPERNQLFIKNISVDQGPVFKRWRPGSRGMAKKYTKKTAHLKITLAIKKPKLNKNGK
jgi:large subunit ribosomal protein L22